MALEEVLSSSGYLTDLGEISRRYRKLRDPWEGSHVYFIYEKDLARITDDERIFARLVHHLSFSTAVLPKAGMEYAWNWENPDSMHMAFAAFTSVNPGDGEGWLTRSNAEKVLGKAVEDIRRELTPHQTKYVTALYFLVVEALDDYLEIADERARRAINDLLTNPEYKLNEGFKYMLMVTRKYRGDAKALIEYALGKPLEQTVTYRLVKRITRDPDRNPWRNVVKNYYDDDYGFRDHKDHPWLRGGVEIFVDPDQETIDFVIKKDENGWITDIKLVRLDTKVWNGMGYSELYVETIKGIFLDQYYWMGELIRTPHYRRVEHLVGWDVNKYYRERARKAYEDLMKHMGLVESKASPFS